MFIILVLVSSLGVSRPSDTDTMSVTLGSVLFCVGPIFGSFGQKMVQLFSRKRVTDFQSRGGCVPPSSTTPADPCDIQAQRWAWPSDCVSGVALGPARARQPKSARRPSRPRMDPSYGVRGA